MEAAVENLALIKEMLQEVEKFHAKKAEKSFVEFLGILEAERYSPSKAIPKLLDLGRAIDALVKLEKSICITFGGKNE